MKSISIFIALASSFSMSFCCEKSYSIVHVGQFDLSLDLDKFHSINYYESIGDYCIGEVGQVGESLFRQPFARAVGRTQKSRNADYISVNDFGPTGVSPFNDTLVVQAALDWLASNEGSRFGLYFPSGFYYVEQVVLLSAVRKHIYMDGALFDGISTVPKTAIFKMVNCVECTIDGQWEIIGVSRPYESGLCILSTGSLSSTRNNICGLTVRNCAVGIKQGTFDVNNQNSETTYLNCNFFACPTAFWGAGSQSGASLVGCNIVSEVHPTFPSLQLIALRLEGGFWYVSGGSIVQTSAAKGNCAIEFRPSAATINRYGALKISNAHIESAGSLVYLNNVRLLTTPDSKSSSIAFSNVGGYISTRGASKIVDTTDDDAYEGKIVFNNGTMFYGDFGSTRTSPHIYLGANSRIDLDGDPFGATFFRQGLRGISPRNLGKPRLRGETVLARDSSVTSVAMTSKTLINFPRDMDTDDSGYGAAYFQGGIFTAPQDLKDVLITCQIIFASPAPNSSVWIQVNSNLVGTFVKISELENSCCIQIPIVKKGDKIAVYAVSGSGVPIPLAGGDGNYFRISART